MHAVVSREPIVLVPYDPEWPRRFETERAVLERLLAPWLDAGIHHIGSTAIPGVAAKPVIDMLAGVRDLAEARAAFGPLREASFYFVPTERKKRTISRSPRFDCRRRRTAST